jgi:hypothetical protein
VTTIELAGYLARRMVAEGYSNADAIDAEAMLLRHFAACRRRKELSEDSLAPSYAVAPSYKAGDGIEPMAHCSQPADSGG